MKAMKAVLLFIVGAVGTGLLIAQAGDGPLSAFITIAGAFVTVVVVEEACSRGKGGRP
jgi:uncharacterized membrane protein YoaK (UPF0700 family)